MKEEEYIKVSNLAHIKDAERALQMVTACTSEIIDEKEFLDVVLKLRRWRIEHFQQIETES